MHSSVPLAIEPQRTPVRQRLGLPPVTHIDMEWDHICRDVTRRHIRQAYLVDLGALVSLTALLTLGYNWVPLLFGPIPAALTSVGLLFGAGWVGWVAVVVQVTLIIKQSPNQQERAMTYYKKKYGSDPKIIREVNAIEEEHSYREGAEHWTFAQRIWSCVAFAYAHSFWRWIYPWPLLLIRFMAGAQLMWLYLGTYRATGSRQAALHEAAVLHYCANTDTHTPEENRRWTVSAVSVALTFALCLTILQTT